MNIDQLSAILTDLNEPGYRQGQFVKNYVSARYASFMDMTDLPLKLRQYVTERLTLYSVCLETVKTLPKTRKAVLKLSDGQKIESVLMDYDGWLTACVSSQVGCSLGCKFCATSQMGLRRNLTAEEIIDQVLYWNHALYPNYVGRVVFMGMGEPFLNWDNFTKALDFITSPKGLNIGYRKISVSTAGIVPRINEFISRYPQVNLAISLHAATDEVRQTIMPVARLYPLDALKSAALNYCRLTKRQLFFEYALINGVNDSVSDIINLADFINSHYLFFLNLIPLNPVKGGLVPTPPKEIAHIETLLKDRQVKYTIRKTYGQDISAACGQLVV